MLNFSKTEEIVRPPLFIDNAIDKMTTQLNKAINMEDMDMVRHIVLLAGPNGIKELNQFFSMIPFNTMERDKIITEYNHNTPLDPLAPPLLLERQLTNYGQERLFKTCAFLEKYINPRIPVIEAFHVVLRKAQYRESAMCIFEFLKSMGADTTGVDEYTGRRIY